MAATGMPPANSSRDFGESDQFRGLDLDSLGVGIKIDSPLFGEGPLKINGAPLTKVSVEHIPGHSPGSVGLIVGEGNSKILICGDVLLNPITPHPDDLLEYLRSLEKLGARQDIALTLPAHGEEIRDLGERVELLKDHHRNRLWLTFEACSQEKSVWDIATMPGYFDSYVDPCKFNFLAGLEALVHMELLNMVDGLTRTDIKNGVHYFKKTEERFEDIYGRIDDLVQSENPVAIMRY
jgi:glyoxylase-like metal-dependent hydrolase (beta-lactamase superfamily II)